MAVGNLAARFLVALIGAPIIVLAIYQDHHAWLWGLVFAASLLAMYEFFAMSLDDRTDRWASLVCGAGASAAFYWLADHRGGHLLALVAAVVPISIYYLFRFGELATVAARMATSVAGTLYAGFLFTFLAMLKRDFDVDEADLVILVLLIAWVGDTGAYFAGRFLGQTKLYPAISPGKTWAGAIGGLLASVGAAAAVKALLLDDPSWTWVDVPLMAAPAAALGQIGDLVESMIKRSRGVKDSGAILPGHGGILDRIDAVLFIAPYIYLYLCFVPAL